MGVKIGSVVFHTRYSDALGWNVGMYLILLGIFDFGLECSWNVAMRLACNAMSEA